MAAKQARMPLVLITGSSGLIGTRLSEALEKDYRVVGLDIAPSKNGRPWLECDLTDDRSVTETLDRVRREYGQTVTSVVHLAAYYDFSGEPSPLYKELTVEGTRRLLEGLKSLDVEQFIFASTLLVMHPSEQPLTPSSPVQAEWDYPKSKLAAEQVIAENRGDTPAVILRIAGVYDDDCRSIPIAHQISRIHQKQLESYVFPGDKTHGQAFVHLDDLVQCFRCAIARRQALNPHEVFVIGEEDVLSYDDLQNTIGQLIHGTEWPTIRIPKFVAKAGAWVKEKLATSEEEEPFIKPWMIDLADQNYPVDQAAARSRLGWEPRHTLRETLPIMIDRLKDDPRRWYAINALPTPEGVRQEQSTNA